MFVLKRRDLICISLSDPDAVKNLTEGDFIVNAHGRHYFSNDEVLAVLHQTSQPLFKVSVGSIPAADVYLVNPPIVAAIKNIQPR